MAPFQFGYDPNLPGRKRMNQMLGTDLRDPTAFLEQLAARRVAPVSVASKPKTKQEPKTETVSPPVQPPPATPATPATTSTPTPTPAAPARLNDARSAAKALYEQELSGFSEIERQGGRVDPLSKKRALQRYNNELGRISAVEDRETRKTNFWNDVKARKARQTAATAKANAIAQEALDRSSAQLEQSMQTAKPVKSIDELNAEYTTKLGDQYDANRIISGAKEQRDWLDHAISNAVKTLQNAAKSTPTARAAEIAAPGATPPINVPEGLYGNQQAYEPVPRPAPTPAPAPAPAAPAPTGNQFSYDYTHRVNQELDAIRAGKPSPFGPGYSDLALGSFAGTIPQMDPATAQATKLVSDRYKAMGVDPMDPNVTSRYMQDVERELRNMTPGGQAGAPVALPAGQSPGFVETAVNTLAGPGGLIGPSVDPALVEREIATAPTQAARGVAEVRQATGPMRDALETLAGGGFISRGGSVPEMPAPTTRVIDNPMVEGASRPILRGPGVLNVNPASPYAGRMMDVTPGKVGKPVTVVPGREGQIADMPAPQAIPGVTPRDLPTSRGGPRQGPMQPIAPAGTADEGFTAPTRKVKNVPAPIKNPSGQRRTEANGAVPASPTGKEQGPATAAAQSNARVRELRAQDRVTDIINNLVDIGVLPRKAASEQTVSTPEAKPTSQPETPATQALSEIAKPAAPSPVETKTTAVQANTITSPGLTPGQKQAAVKALEEQMASGKITKQEFDLAVNRMNNLGLSPIPVTPEPIAATPGPTKATKKGLVPGKAGTANPQ